jgi:MFS transporter, DHA2 family, methylenomycin A resistance protein
LTLATPAAPARTARPGLPASALACLGVTFLISMDSTTMSVVGPGIAGSLDASASQTQWMVNAFLLAISVLLVAAGTLAGRVGEVPMLRVGLGLFALGAAVAAAAPSMGPLLAGRALQGAGAACAVPSAIGLFRSHFAPARQPVAMSVYAGTSVAGGAVGPILAGALVDAVSWRVLFSAVAVLSLVLVALLPRGVRRRVHRPGAPGDTRALVSVNVVFGLALMAAIWALIRVGQRGWGDPGVIAGLAVGAVLLGVVIAAIAHRRADAARAGIQLGVVGTAAALLVTASVGMLGTIFLLSAFLQDVQDHSPFRVGVELLPLLATSAVLMPAAGRLSLHWSPQRLLVVGLVVQIAGLVVLTRLAPDSGYALIAVGLVLLGAGNATIVPALLNTLLGAAPPAHAAAMGAINLCFNQLGGIVGVALLGSVALTSGTVDALWVGVGCLGLALVLALMTGRRLAPRAVPHARLPAE